MGAIEQTLAALGGLVIPGRCRKAAASPESILPDLWLWIPGSRPAAEPRNDETRFRPNTPRRSEAKPSLVDRTHCVGAVERKRRDLDFKAFAIKGDHPVGAGHETRRGRQRDAAGIFERRAGLEHRFLANNARPAYFLLLPDAVGDDPMPRLELDRLIPAVS